MIDQKTKEVLSEYDAQSKWNVPRNAITEQPLPKKSGFAVVVTLDENGLPIGTEYKEDNRGIAIYDKSDCSKSEQVKELGPVKDGFTKIKPSSKFDSWNGEKWVTDINAKYQNDYELVDEARRAEYLEKVTPLMEEAHIKRNLIGSKESIAEAEDIERRVLNMRAKIQKENPWPTKPQ